MQLLPPPRLFVVDSSVLWLWAGSLIRPTAFVVWDDLHVENFRLIQGRYRVGRVCLNGGLVYLSGHIPGADIQHLASSEPVAKITTHEAKLFNSAVNKNQHRKFYG